MGVNERRKWGSGENSPINRWNRSRYRSSIGPMSWTDVFTKCFGRPIGRASVELKNRCKTHLRIGPGLDRWFERWSDGSGHNSTYGFPVFPRLTQNFGPFPRGPPKDIWASMLGRIKGFHTLYFQHNLLLLKTGLYVCFFHRVL